MIFYKVLLLATVTLTLAACGGDPGGGGSSASVAAELASRTLTPADSAIAAIYNRSCRNCHTIAATGAPLTGDTEAWASRLTKGRATLVDNVVNGFGGMPPFGMCMDCDLEQFGALVDFMVKSPDTDPS